MLFDDYSIFLGLYYGEFVKLVGGVKGTLDSVTTFSHKYLWVNFDGGTLHATFDENGKCTILMEYFNC